MSVDQTDLFLNESVDSYEQTVVSSASEEAGVRLAFGHKRLGTRTRLQFLRSHIVWFATAVLSLGIVGLLSWDTPTDTEVAAALDFMAGMSAASMADAFHKYTFR